MVVVVVVSVASAETMQCPETILQGCWRISVPRDGRWVQQWAPATQRVFYKVNPDLRFGKV